jgi:glucans biosynthesis protein C
MVDESIGIIRRKIALKTLGEKSRFLYIDNLRLLIIIFVVMVHLAVTYSGIGSWYFMDTHELDLLSAVFFGLFQSYTQAYFMGFLFLISGYFVAKSYDKKGTKRFIMDRLIRLGIPTLIYMLLIHPFIVYVLIGDTWRRPSFIRYYTDYLISFDFIGSSGPLWFAFALLIFNCIYVLVRILTKKHQIRKNYMLPGVIAKLILVLAIAIFAFLIRLVQPIDTDILNMQLCFFSQYIILFIVGVKAGRYDWFTHINYKSGRSWLLVALILGIISWAVLMVTGGALDGDGFDLYKGGLTWQSVAYALWESFIAVSMSIGLIGIFREKCNKQSRLIKGLTDNSFGVYVFHAPIIISVSLLLANLQLHPVLKFVLACVVGIPISFLFSHYIFRRIPLLKKVL